MVALWAVFSSTQFSPNQLKLEGELGPAASQAIRTPSSLLAGGASSQSWKFIRVFSEARTHHFPPYNMLADLKVTIKTNTKPKVFILILKVSRKEHILPLGRDTFKYCYFTLVTIYLLAHI